MTEINRPTSIMPLVILRIAFGLLMFISNIRFIAQGWVAEFYLLPEFHFTYSGFGWVHPLPEWGMWAIFILLGLLSLGITLGLFTRASMVGFFLLFTYVELIDKAFYLNHYYFVSILSFLLCFLPLHGAYSLDVHWGLRSPIAQVPAWMLHIVRLQLGLVYFFAGVAKLNPDWLFQALPLAIWLPARTSTPLLGWLFDYKGVPYLMSWAGMIFDLTIAGWLWWKRSRPYAYGVVVLFHALTAVLFQIGIFPWIMIACTLIFFDWQSLPAPQTKQIASTNRVSQTILALFLLSQLLLPMRHWFYAGHVNWTEEGFRFAWRVMLVEKTGHVTFFVTNPQTNEEWVILPHEYLTLLQEQQMSYQPDMIVQFAHYLAQQFPYPVTITAEVYVSLNGRSSRLLIDPTADLTQITPNWQPRPWINPIQ